jgi:hypothetical protein
MLQLLLDVKDGTLEVVPEALRFAGDGSRFHLVKPERCRNTIVPTWLLWRMGKPGLRRKIADLDELLLERAREGAERLSLDDGPLGQLRLDGPDGSPLLRLQDVATDHGSLLVTLAGGAGSIPAGTAQPDWVAPLAGRSFIGLSESFLNAMIERRIAGLPARRFEPGGTFGDALQSGAGQALIPGLRERGLPAGAWFTFAIPTAPRVEFGELRPAAGAGAAEATATLRVTLAGVAIRIHSPDAEAPIGTLTIDSAVVTVVPYASVAGGVSFAMLQNEWTLSSSGIEFNEPLLAAALQEAIFGEVFVTGSEPLLTDALAVGGARFDPRWFRRAGEHLVVELGAGTPEAPTRTDSLHASR